MQHVEDRQAVHQASGWYNHIPITLRMELVIRSDMRAPSCGKVGAIF